MTHDDISKQNSITKAEIEDAPRLPFIPARSFRMPVKRRGILTRSVPTIAPTQSSYRRNTPIVSTSPGRVNSPIVSTSPARVNSPIVSISPSIVSTSPARVSISVARATTPLINPSVSPTLSTSRPSVPSVPCVTGREHSPSTTLLTSIERSDSPASSIQSHRSAFTKPSISTLLDESSFDISYSKSDLKPKATGLGVSKKSLLEDSNFDISYSKSEVKHKETGLGVSTKSTAKQHKISNAGTVPVDNVTGTEVPKLNVRKSDKGDTPRASGFGVPKAVTPSTGFGVPKPQSSRSKQPSNNQFKPLQTPPSPQGEQWNDDIDEVCIHISLLLKCNSSLVSLNQTSFIYQYIYIQYIFFI